MKILLANKFYYLKGGAERYFFDLKTLLEEKGNKVIPFAMQDERNFKMPYDKYFVSHQDFEKPKFSLKAAGRIFYSLEAKKNLEALILRERPDIAHLHNIYHQISPSILTVLKKHKIPIVMTLHDFKILCPIYILYTHGAICERCKTYRYWQCTLRKCTKNSRLASFLNTCEMFFHKFLGIYEKNVDLFIAPSEFSKNKISEWGRLPEEKIKVLPHFTNSKFHPESQAGNETLLQDQDGEYVLYFGRLSHEKGMDILLKAIMILKNLRDSRTKFYIAGSGPKEEELKKFVVRNSLQEKVKFLGYLKGDVLNEAIKNSLFTVMPSLVYESFGMAALESFGLGKPVLTSNLGALPELVEEGKTGMLFRVGDINDLAKKLSLMCRDKNKLKEMGGKAQRLAREKYNKEAHWQRLERIYSVCANVPR